jgi:hypothetical protein
MEMGWNNWIWVGGSNVINQSGTYSSIDVTDTTTFWRQKKCCHVEDKSNNIYLLVGGCDTGSVVEP